MNSITSTSHWHRLYGDALATGTLKAQAEDFMVNEELGFELTGEGEHSALLIEKTNTNTAFLGEQIAKFAGVPLRDVGYCGRKDKFAVTRQWFSVYHSNRKNVNWNDFDVPNCRLIQATRHNRKLKTGSHKANQFIITLRDFVCDDIEQLEQRMQLINQAGFANYFGQQRFGEMRQGDRVILNNNLLLGERMIQGEKINNRNKRNMVISALRSWLFNEYVSERISQNLINTVIDGDVLMLSGSNSFFVSEPGEREVNQQRLAEGDVKLSAPLWGDGELPSKHEAHSFEASIANQYPSITESLIKIGLAQQRRPVLEYVADFSYSLEPQQMKLTFSLGKGTFATSVLREFMATKSEDANENIAE